MEPDLSRWSKRYSASSDWTRSVMKPEVRLLIDRMYPVVPLDGVEDPAHGVDGKEERRK